jgi:predicted TIM-barrel fold metal-dependent hydrolase
MNEIVDKIWANSADSHVMEPTDLWTSALPASIADRAPRTERDERTETIYVDNKIQRRALNSFLDSFRPPGAYDTATRLKDLDQEGIWAQLVFPSMGLWTVMIDDRELAQACVQAYNDWCHADLVQASGGRIIGAACLSMASVDDAVSELQRAAGMGFRCAFLPTEVPPGSEYADDRWRPLWAAAEEAGVVIAFHIGTGSDAKVYRGPGGAVINYVETTFPGMRVVAHMVASGVLDRHPGLKIHIAEGGASWVPAIADRMDEAYRQHGEFVQPKLSLLPSELIYRQVYSSFQHDRSAVPAVTGMGYRNVMWGDDYPHLEGTYGHTQETLHALFDGVDDAVRRLVTIDAFGELLGAPAPPAA